MDVVTQLWIFMLDCVNANKVSVIIQHILDLNTIGIILQTTFSNIFCFMKWFVFWLKLYYVSLGIWVSTGSVNGVAPTFTTMTLDVTRCNTPWWRHQIETFSALLVLCAGNSLVTTSSDAELCCFIWSAPERRLCNIPDSHCSIYSALEIRWHLMRKCHLISNTNHTRQIHTKHKPFADLQPHDNSFGEHAKFNETLQQL